jgi:hypothetical protein
MIGNKVLSWYCATEIYIRWHETKCRERTCSKYTKVVMRLWNAAKICKSAHPHSACSAHTHYKRISHYGFCAWWSEISFIVCSCDSSAKHLHKHTLLQLRSTFSYFTLFAVRTRYFTLHRSFSLCSVCVPRFAARVITACRNKLANTNINRELRKRVVVVALSEDCWLAYFPGDDGRKKVGGC